MTSPYMSNRKRKRQEKRQRHPKRAPCVECGTLHGHRVKKGGPLWDYCSHECRKGVEVREALRGPVFVDWADRVSSAVFESVQVPSRVLRGTRP
jgi:hypothetical protein